MYFNNDMLGDTIRNLVKLYNDYARRFNAECKDIEDYLPFMIITEVADDPDESM